MPTSPFFPTSPPGPLAKVGVVVGTEMLSALTLHAPLLGLESARLILRCHERQLTEWILDGSVEWAFDFRRAGSRRSHLRILPASLLRLRQRQHPLTPREKAAQGLHPFAPVFDAIFPGQKKLLPGTELARVWNCSGAHLHHLVEDGLLEMVKKNYMDREARQFSRETVFHFMQSRRVQ